MTKNGHIGTYSPFKISKKTCAAAARLVTLPVYVLFMSSSRQRKCLATSKQVGNLSSLNLAGAPKAPWIWLHVARCATHWMMQKHRKKINSRFDFPISKRWQNSSNRINNCYRRLLFPIHILSYNSSSGVLGLPIGRKTGGQINRLVEMHRRIE